MATGEGGYCNAKLRKRDGQCRRPAGWGTDHVGRGPCKWHSGNVPTVRAHHAKAELQEQLALGFVNPVEMTATQAIIWTVHLAAGAVQWLREKLVERGEGDMIGYIYGESGHAKEAKPSPWVQLYNEERDRLLRASKLALDAGVAERQVRIAEQQGQMVASAIRMILDRLELTEGQRAIAPGIVREALTLLPTQEPMPRPDVAGAALVVDAVEVDGEDVDWESV